MVFPVEKIRADFPILSTRVYNKPLVYFDNAATTQKPLQVIRAITEYYEKENCNIHRGVHFLSVRATEAYEDARCVIRDFIHAKSCHEIIFTRGTTESINLVAASFGKQFIHEGDEVITSVMEHHSNFVPWQQMCLERKATLKFIPLLEDGSLDMDAYREMITPNTRLVAVTHISNVLGTINPVNEIIALAHQHNIPVLIDGAQAVAHMNVDVQEMDADFYCFSGHKMYAPMGIGILYGKERWLEQMPPYQMGGEMIKEVFFTHTTFNELPFKFEAGTPNVEGAMGVRTAIRYLGETGMDRIDAYEKELLGYATQRLLEIDGIQLYGTAPHKASLISFLMNNIHPYDAGMIIDKLGIAVRTGHLCAQPLMEYLKIPGTIRASFAFYNTNEEIDRLVEAVKKAKEMLL
ncbi:MAG: cysteine desulfurase [Bacteroidales bacterium]|nr:cysteine desulfurase [Bacteroidales bacterium]